MYIQRPGIVEVATMPSKPRSDVFDPDEVGVYHCWNRLVQRRHLFDFNEADSFEPFELASCAWEECFG